MRTLSRPHRQVLFTLGILVATMVPTALVAFTAWQVNRPGHRHDVEAELGRQLGLKVTLEGVRYPKPGEIIYSGAVLWQREPRREKQLVEVARAETLKLSREGRRLVLRAEGLALAAEGPRHAMEQVGELLSRAAADEAWDHVAVSADSCAIDLGDGLQYGLRDLAASFRIDAGAPTVEASYRVVTPSGSANRCELVLVRDRRGNEPETILTLRTAEGLPLPASVLDPFFSSADWIGSAARMQGELRLSRIGAGDWRASFSGELIDVDLATLVSGRVTEHRLDGLAHLIIDEAEWGPQPLGPGSGWRSVSGELRAGPGAISSGLLQALQAEMRFPLAERFQLLRTSTAADQAIAFGDLGVRFAIEPDGSMLVAGALGDAFEQDAIMIEPERLEPIAFAPATEADVFGLRRTLGPVDPGNAVLVPADPALKFIDYLPQGGAGADRSEVIRAN
ncbi:hypothetical protein AB1L88_13405 [Tautonia sp. JC769]|uniref:hypothetical protein n=1 Tax=Tautonia sp. JC769 TaxID=3232135 RepID=UPI003457E676